MRCRVSGATVVTMTTSTPSPEDITPEEPGADELASADQVSHLPPSDTTLSPEHPIEGGDAARDAEADDTGEAEPDVAATGTVNQLPAEDTLEDTGGRDRVEEGFNAPDAPGPLYERTIEDEITRDGVDERVEIEEPEVWERPEPDDEAGSAP